MRQALDDYKALVEASPENMSLQERLADVLLEDGQMDAARLVYRMIARHWESEGFHLRAIQLWRKLVDLAPADLNARRHLGDLYVSLHAYDRARQVYLQLAETFAVQGNRTRTIVMIEAVLAFAPDDVDLRLSLVRELDGAGNEALALEHLVWLYEHLYAMGLWAQLLPIVRRVSKRLPDDRVWLERVDEAERAVRATPAHENAVPPEHRRGESSGAAERAREGRVGGIFAAFDRASTPENAAREVSLQIALTEMMGETENSVLARLDVLEERGSVRAQRSALSSTGLVTNAAPVVLGSLDEVPSSGEVAADSPQPVLSPPPMGSAGLFGRRPFGPSSEVLLRETGHVVAAAIRARHRGDAVLALALLEDEAAQAWPQALAFERAMGHASRQQWREALYALEWLQHESLAPHDEALVAYHMGLVCEMSGDFARAVEHFEHVRALCADEAPDLPSRLQRLRSFIE